MLSDSFEASTVQPLGRLTVAKATKAKAEAKRFEQQATAHEEAGYPITPQVVAACGGWTNAIKAAGLKPRRETTKQKATKSS